MAEWNQARVQQLINDGVEEGLTLDYKAAAALYNTDPKKTEITKDVSALANSAGGLIIYGVKEFEDKGRRHLPEKIDPVSRNDISKEWLEQVISGIRPRIDNLVIYPVPIAGVIDQVVYIVDVPQSETAHQAKDSRYYRRYNFESVPMADHEIRDVMGRIKHPNIEVECKFVRSKYEYPYPTVPGRRLARREIVELVVTASNIGRILASFVNCNISLPERWCNDDPLKSRYLRRAIGEPVRVIRATNTVRDISGNKAGIDQYGPARYDPILPATSMEILKLRISALVVEEGFDPSTEPGEISWTLHADNAPSKSGDMAIKDISVKDLRKA